MERASGQLLGGAEFSAALADVLRSSGVPPYRPVTDEELGRVRTLRSALTARWNDTVPGETLTVPFPALPA